jgi:hypothetical protein
VDVADVATGWRENNLLVSVRVVDIMQGGLGLCDDGMVIDLSGLKICIGEYQNNTEVEVDAASVWLRFLPE